MLLKFLARSTHGARFLSSPHPTALSALSRTLLHPAGSHPRPRSEEAVLREGYQLGFTEAVTKLNVEVERAAGAAFARSLAEEEGARAAQLADAVAQLRKEQYRAPRRALECAAEEAAVLACEDPAASEPLIQAYVQCARAVVSSRMLHPPSGALR